MPLPVPIEKAPGSVSVVTSELKGYLRAFVPRVVSGFMAQGNNCSFQVAGSQQLLEKVVGYLPQMWQVQRIVNEAPNRYTVVVAKGVKFAKPTMTSLPGMMRRMPR